jgi:integrase
MSKVELPASLRSQVRGLTSAEIGALRDACRGDWTFPFVELALATGCRRGELLALEWRDVGFQTRTITVERSIEQTRAGVRCKSTKSDRTRRFTLPEIAIEALWHQRFHFGSARLVFAGPDGGYRKPDLVSQVVVRRMVRAGIRDASLHSLRHTHASHLLSRGVPLPAVSARLGHVDSNITARIYAHALPMDDARSAAAWDSVIGVKKVGEWVLPKSA